MMFTVDNRSFFKLKEPQNQIYYIETEERVELFFQREGAWVTSVYWRPDSPSAVIVEGEDRDLEAESTAYLLWKQQHLAEVIRVLEAKYHKVNLVVSAE